MDCRHCDATLPVSARFCPSCGARVMLWESPSSDDPIVWEAELSAEPGGGTAPRSTPKMEELKASLIDCYLNFSMANELTRWLEELGLPSTGTTQEKLARLHQQSGSLVLPAESQARQTIYYLNRYDRDILAEICEEFGIDGTGTREHLLARLYHEVGIREGWLDPLSEEAHLLIAETFLPMLCGFDPQNSCYRELREELCKAIGREHKPLHTPQAYGSAVATVLVPSLFQEAQAALLQAEIMERAGKRG